jgi:hypothetical protein
VKAVLNVGGNDKAIAISAHFNGWRHDMLDIDPASKADIIMDAREMTSLPGGQYDAVYCSHNLEHYHRQDCVKVLRGFHHVLKPDGFVEVWVPDLEAIMQHVVKNKMDIDDMLYMLPLPTGPILVRDAIYGFHKEIEVAGNEFFMHKTGFTRKSIHRLFSTNGFPYCAIGTLEGFQLGGYFFKQEISPEARKLLNLPGV